MRSLYDPALMKTHSENDIQAQYIGTALVNGRLCHRWLDGTTLPVLFGASDDGGDGDGSDGDGDDDSGDGDDDDEGDGSDEGDEGEDEDDDDKSSKSSRRIHRLSRENAKYRTQRNKFKTDLESERTAHAATKQELADLKKSGVSDDTVKAQIATLTKERDEAQTELKALKAESQQRSQEAEVQSLLDELNIDCEADVAISRLRKNGVTPDDDGEFEDLEAQLKKLLKKGVFRKKASDDGDDAERNGSTSGGSSGASRSGRSTGNAGKRRDGKVDQTKLRQKYPALQR